MKNLNFLIYSFFAINLFFQIPAHSAQTAKGMVKIDGSSTVFPITEAVAEEFNKEFRKVRVTIGVSGTGGGFKKFTKGITDINNASRPIKDGEKKAAIKNKIKYLEFPVAYDGITLVINKENSWVDHLTVAELQKIWGTGSTVKNWKDVRPNWPNRKIKLYGPGTDSGTFDYFTKAINGKSGASRSGYTKSEDDNVLVQGVIGDKDALGYFGYAYYKENKKKLKAVPVKVGKNAAITPTETSIQKGTYKPLSRPIFIYVRETSLTQPAVREFVSFYMKRAKDLVSEVGYVPMPSQIYQAATLKVEQTTAKK